MFHKGARSTGGDLDAAFTLKIGRLLDQFSESTESRMRLLQVRRAIVRSALQCSLLVILDENLLWVAAQKTSGMPTTFYLDRRSHTFSREQVLDAAQWEFGFDEPFILGFPVPLLDMEPTARAASLEAIAQSHVAAEVARVQAKMNVVQISPLFGPASYAVDPRLTFVLMPFTDELTEIYQAFIKPVVESADFNLVCRRADDVKSNRAIIQDIWKSLCESRFVIADLTGSMQTCSTNSE